MENLKQKMSKTTISRGKKQPTAKKPNTRQPKVKETDKKSDPVNKRCGKGKSVVTNLDEKQKDKMKM